MHASTNTTVTVLGIDSEKERKIELGPILEGAYNGETRSVYLGTTGKAPWRRRQPRAAHSLLRVDILELVTYITQSQGGLRGRRRDCGHRSC